MQSIDTIPGDQKFQLRFSPSLANKPKGPPPGPGDDKKKPFNPFENPPPSLVIGDAGLDHVLVLNKFAIVPEHFLLITRRFKKQTDLLEAGDLAATYSCLRAYHAEGGRELFAFFNCGPHSGASQPHRHLQLLPVDRMADGLGESNAAAAAAGGGPGAWSVLADRLVAGEGDESPPLPFATFAERLDGDLSPRALRSVYLRLYRRACAAAGCAVAPRKDVGSGAVAEGRETGEEELEEEEGEDEDEGDEGVEAKISYNLAMTRETMVICPRVAEGDVVRDQGGQEVGRLALNGTVLAGTALVKNEAEWDALRRDGGAQLWKLLGSIGVRTDAGTGGGDA